MSGLFSKPKIVMPPPVKMPQPVQPPAPPQSASDTNAGEMSFLRSRRRKGSGLAGLILTPLGSGGSPTAPGATKPTLGA